MEVIVGVKWRQLTFQDHSLSYNPSDDVTSQAWENILEVEKYQLNIML